MLIKAWLSIGMTQSAWLTSSFKANKLLYGEVTTSSLSLEGKTLAVNLKTSGKLSSKTN